MNATAGFFRIVALFLASACVYGHGPFGRGRHGYGGGGYGRDGDGLTPQPTNVYVSKQLNVRSSPHRLTTQAFATGAFTPVTGENAEAGEVSYFTGYSSPAELDNGHRWWDAAKWLPQKTCSFDKPIRLNGPQAAVYVSRQGCEKVPTVKLYHARCVGEQGYFMRVGRTQGLCGGGYHTQIEKEFFALEAGLTCGELPRMANGQQIPTLSGPLVTSYRFTCDTGHRIVGAASIQCDHNGRWSAPQPTCTVIRCPKLSPPQNGRLDTTKTTYGTIVRYVCDPGYNAVGSSMRCQDNGQWRPANGMSCQPVDCGYHPRLRNGYVSSSRTVFGSRLYFSCQQGFVLEGASEAVCDYRGNWRYGNSQRPVCQEILCPSLTHPNNGRASGSENSIGAERTFICYEGYEMVGNATITCQESGTTAEWSGPVPSCELIRCQPPKAPSNGQVLGTDFRYGQHVTYICNTGHKLVGSDRSFCTAKGWSGQAPTCAATICRDLGVPSNGNRSGENFAFGSAVTFTCNSGYVLIGASTVVCTKDGTWTDKRPECQPVTCDPVYAPQHGTRDGDVFVFPARVLFSCFPGYEMEGETEARCQANGTWSSRVPVCKACPIGFYRESGGASCQQCPANSTTTTTASTTRGLCTCNPGTVGPPGGPCTAVECTPLVAPENGEMSVCANSQNSECMVTCEAGYYLSSGDAARRCTADGWTGRPAVCTVCPANTYTMQSGAWSCTPCPQNTVTQVGEPAGSVNACRCAPGFQGHAGGPCEDVDECKEKNGGCNQRCENTPGSFRCSCTIPGYEVDTDGKTCVRKRLCEQLHQTPENGHLNCQYTAETNSHVCKIKCNTGYSFVSGINDYVTCGPQTEFKWSHQVVNPKARIPACTRENFYEMELPIIIEYTGEKGCSARPSLTEGLFTSTVQAAIDGATAFRDKCKVRTINIGCDETNKQGTFRVHLDIILKNVNPSAEVPLQCLFPCRRDNLRKMLANTFALKNELVTLVKTKAELLKIETENAPVLNKDFFRFNRPRQLCATGWVLSRDRLCVPCAMGYYLPKPDERACSACPRDTYQDELGQDQCKPCGQGSTTLHEGSDRPSLCSQPVNIGNGTYVQEPDGKYKDTVDEVDEGNAEEILDSAV